MNYLVVFFTTFAVFCSVISAVSNPGMPFGLISSRSGSLVHLIPAGVSNDRKLVQLGASNPFVGIFDDQGHVKVNDNEYLTVSDGKLALTPTAPGAVFSDDNGIFTYPQGKGFLANATGILPYDILISQGNDNGNTPFELRIVLIRTENVTTTVTTKITTAKPPPITSFANVTTVPNVTITRTVSKNTSISAPSITIPHTMTQIGGGAEALVGFGAVAVAGVAALLF